MSQTFRTLIEETRVETANAEQITKWLTDLEALAIQGKYDMWRLVCISPDGSTSAVSGRVPGSTANVQGQNEERGC